MKSRVEVLIRDLGLHKTMAMGAVVEVPISQLNSPATHL
jgi:hypothetical protein